MSKEILKLTGAIIAIGEMQSGVSKKTGKEWTAQEIVIKPEGKYAKTAAFREFNPVKDLTELYKVKDFVEICFNVASREYNHKWYTNLDAWEIRKIKDSKETLDFDKGEKKEGTHVEKPEAVNESDDLPF